MARKYSESRTYQIGVNEIGDRVRALIIVGGKGYTPGYEKNIDHGIEIGMGHSLSMKSYGENITVGIVDQGNGQTMVNVFSTNAWPLQLGDMGQNKKNAEEIFNAIETRQYLNMMQQQGMPWQGMPPQQGMPPNLGM